MWCKLTIYSGVIKKSGKRPMDYMVSDFSVMDNLKVREYGPGRA